MFKDNLGKLTSIIFHFVTSIRYEIKVNNIELIKDGEWLLLFPNHPALIDPIILTWVIGRHILFSPVISKEYSDLPILSLLFSYFWTEYIDSRWTPKGLHKSILTLKNKLLQKENILLYPAWTIYAEWIGSISGKRMAYLMAKEWAYNKVIWVRIEGLWWSIWSKAMTGGTPNIGKNLLLGLYYTIVNGIFFVPKREVKISFHDITKDIEVWSHWDKTSFNKNLEDFYNNHPVEAKYIPHYFYYDDTQKIIADKSLGIQPENDSFNKNTESDFPYSVFLGLKEVIERVKQRGVSKLEWGTNLIRDLEMDSLDMMELKILVQRKYPWASNPEIQSLKTLRDIWRMALWQSNSITTYEPSWSILRLLLLRWFLCTFDWEKIWVLLDKRESENFINVVDSLGKIGVNITSIESEESFIKIFQEIDSKIIITSKSQVNSIRSPWFAKYEHNIIFIEDIASRKSSREYLWILLRWLCPPYRSGK